MTQPPYRMAILCVAWDLALGHGRILRAVTKSLPNPGCLVLDVCGCRARWGRRQEPGGVADA